MIEANGQHGEFFLTAGCIGALPSSPDDLASLSFYNNGDSVDDRRGGDWHLGDLCHGTVPERSSLLAMSVFGLGMLGCIRRRR